MSSLITKKKEKKFVGSNKAIYTTRDNNIITLYAGFIIKPHKQFSQQEDNKKYRRYNEEEEETTPTILDILKQLKVLDISVHRMFLPANVKRKNQDDPNLKKGNGSSLLDELFEDSNSDIDVKLSFYLIKVWKKYNISESFSTIDDLAEDFVFQLRNELKQKLEVTGRVGRLLDSTLEELILYGTIDQNNFLSTGKKKFSELTRDYSIIEKNTLFHKNFIPGPAVDQRPKGVFQFPSGIESDDSLILGQSENETSIGLPLDASFPILLAGDKKTREVITTKLLEGDRKFIILDPRMNLEFQDRIHKSHENLVLGDNLIFNVLTPVLNDYIPEKIGAQYLGNFIDLIRLVSDVRSDGAVLLRDLYEFYVNDYQEEQEDMLFPRNDVQVSLNDLYTMLTVEPGGLVITDYQLSLIRSLINEIRDPSISEITKINEKKGLEELFQNNMMIDFSAQGYKIQRLFIYSFLLQLSIYDQLSKDNEEIIVYIDDAELFFSHDIDKSILNHILKKLESSRFKLILSTPYPSHLARQIFDLSYNRIVGNLKSAKCVKLISSTHGFDRNQEDFLRRLPKNNFLLIREDLAEKPLLLNFFLEDINRHDNQQVRRRVPKKPKETQILEEDVKKLELNYEDFVRLHPIMQNILEKLSSKVNRGINTESLANLFTNWLKEEVQEAITALEMFGYIFRETVDRKGKKDEYWSRITPRGKKFLDKLKYSKLVEEKNVEVSQDEDNIDLKHERVTDHIESSNVVELKEKEEFNPVINKLKILRKLIRGTRDSNDTAFNKLEILNSFLVQIDPLLDDSYPEEKMKLVNFLGSLQNLIAEKESADEIPEKILLQIFQKSLSLVDSIQIKATFGEETVSSKDDEFIDKIIEKELNSEKWKDFERDIFLTEIPELSKMSKDKKQIKELLSSDYPEEVLKGLELSTGLPKEEFIDATKEAIASLLQIKTMFFPNMESDDYLEEVNDFFKSTGYPEPFEKAQQLLWEYSVVKKKETPKSAYTKKSRREIIESIQSEKDAFEFDTKTKDKDSLVSQLVSSIRDRIKNE